MGNLNASCRNWHHLLGWGGIPDTDRATYFNERLMCGWYELLCCPSAMGCTVVNFEPKNPNGGEAQYKIKMRLSHSEHVPRYQLHVVSGGATRQWIVGHMEKTETHLRAKPGEFIRAQVWKLTCNSMVWERRRSSLQRKDQLCMSAVKVRATPSATDMLMMGMTIVTQAKLERMPKRNESDPPAFDYSQERWVQSIGVDNREYKVNVEPPRVVGSTDRLHRNEKSMTVMRVLHRGKKTCVARKQRFAGALGKVEQPFLGVQIKPSIGPPQTESDSDDGVGVLQSLLDTRGLMLLLISLAWSEETMTPQTDMSSRFVEAMRAKPGQQGSAEALGLSVQWDTQDVQDRLRHVPYALFHTWIEAEKSGNPASVNLDEQARSESEEEEEEEAEKDEGRSSR